MFSSSVVIAFPEHQADIKYVNGLTKIDPHNLSSLFGKIEYRIEGFKENACVRYSSSLKRRSEFFGRARLKKNISG